MGRERPLLLALTLVACDRAPANEPRASLPVVEPTTAAPTKVVVPTEAAPIVATPAAIEPPREESPPVQAAPSSPSTIGATDGAKPTLAPRGRAKPPTVAPPVVPAAPGAAPAPATTGELATPFATKTLVTEKLFRIELAPLAPCKAAAPCEAKLVVHALGGFKVNAEYPSKFVVAPAPGVTVDGTGSFAVGSKTTGTMTVTFRAAAAGTSKIAGALKLSVCTDDICEIAAPVVTFNVPVT